MTYVISFSFVSWIIFYFVHNFVDFRHQCSYSYQISIYDLEILHKFQFYYANCRDVELTEKLDYSSAVALIGFSLIVSILRAFNVRDEAARVMIAAPLIAFVITHILYLNFYKLDYGTHFSENLLQLLMSVLVFFSTIFVEPINILLNLLYLYRCF